MAGQIIHVKHPICFLEERLLLLLLGDTDSLFRICLAPLVAQLGLREKGSGNDKMP